VVFYLIILPGWY